jgi:hypothetical protein
MLEKTRHAPMTFKRAEHISLKLHPDLNERWVQELIAGDPSILGLGELALRDKERMQPRAGRLDLLLEDPDPDAERRYEVEIQLGPTDEAHIIRTIEYWDIERKRYPQYDHCAVLVAEDITSRFLNVISLFNGTIPLIALQMYFCPLSGPLRQHFLNRPKSIQGIRALAQNRLQCRAKHKLGSDPAQNAVEDDQAALTLRSNLFS